MEAVKQTEPSGIPPRGYYIGGVHQQNATGYSSLDRALSDKLPQPSARVHEKVRIDEAKLEELDTLPYTAGVLCSVIAAFFLFGLVGVAIKEARQRKQEEQKGTTTAVSVGSSKVFTRPAGFDVDQLGKRKYDNALCEAGSISSPRKAISISPTSMLPGLSSKQPSFDIDSLGKIRPHLEPEIFASIIAQDLKRQNEKTSLIEIATLSSSKVSTQPVGIDLQNVENKRQKTELRFQTLEKQTRDQKRTSNLAANIIVSPFYILKTEAERYSPNRTGSDPSYTLKAIQKIVSINSLSDRILCHP
ncbi:hypothetical protein QYM36_003412 [Artemia franciscana]|uniref:Uncharacterized protein n=1 Tax=Artemia franciscana TaxID=6661 RepID=A0AA88LGU7_ARTSF|nr:hypothetical protein QYM36_003412 [Artemia franciscana]